MSKSIETQLATTITEGIFFKELFEDSRFITKVNDIQHRIYEEWLESQTPEKQTQLWLKNQALIQLLVEMKEPIILMEQAKVQMEEMNKSF